MHAGIRLLLEIGASRPELLQTGPRRPIRAARGDRDDGLRLERRAAAPRHHRPPLPSPVRTSVGAIIAARLRAAQAYPPPATAADRRDAPPAGRAIRGGDSGAVIDSGRRPHRERSSHLSDPRRAGCGVPEPPRFTTAPTVEYPRASLVAAGALPARESNSPDWNAG
jgi:hypothetical protein